MSDDDRIPVSGGCGYALLLLLLLYAQLWTCTGVGEVRDELRGIKETLEARP